MGKLVNIEAIEEGHKLFTQAMTEREAMIEKLANFDDELADLYLSEEMDAITTTEIDRAIRAAVRS
jgi:translation elongation factor EF-G